MARIKRKFNTKLLKRFNKKELVSFMRKHKLPAEKALGRYTKAEIVSQLIRLQRNKLYFSAFDNLKIKPARTLSETQKKNLASNRLKNKSLNTKQSFPQDKKIDVGRQVENAISVEAGVVNPTEDKMVEASALVNQQLTQFQQIKEQQGLETGQFSNLEELFEFSNKKIDSSMKEMLDLIIARKQERGIAVGSSGKQPNEQEQISQGVEEKSNVEPVGSSFHTKVNSLVIVELKSILDEAQISRRGITLKGALVQLVVQNKLATEQLVNNILKVREDFRKQFNARNLESVPPQKGQVVKDNEGAKSQDSKRNVLPQGDSQSVQDAINKPVGNLDKVKKKNGNGRRKIVVQN